MSQGGAWGHRQGGLQDPLGVPLIKLMPGVRECLTAEFMPALRTGLAYESVLARGNREINSVGFEKRGIRDVFPDRVRSRRECTAIPVRKRVVLKTRCYFLWMSEFVVHAKMSSNFWMMLVSHPALSVLRSGSHMRRIMFNLKFILAGWMRKPPLIPRPSGGHPHSDGKNGA